MKRGEIWWTDFSSSTGGEIKKTRPAVIVSVSASNKALNRVQVVALTSNVSRIYPFEAQVTVKKKPHKAIATQLFTVSKHRLKKRFGRVSDTDMESVSDAIKFQLGLQ